MTEEQRENEVMAGLLFEPMHFASRRNGRCWRMYSLRAPSI